MLAVTAAEADAERLFHAAPQCSERREARAFLQPRQRFARIRREKKRDIGGSSQWRAGEQTTLQKICKAGQQAFPPQPAHQLPETGFVVGEVKPLAHRPSLVDQTVLPKVRRQNETKSRQIALPHLVAVEKCLNAVIGPFDFDNTAVGRNPGAPLRSFAAAKNGLFEQAEIGNSITARGMMKTIDLRRQLPPNLVQQVRESRVIRGFPCPW